MKKVFLLLVAFSIAPIYAANATESSLVGLSLTGFAAIGSFIVYRIYQDSTTSAINNSQIPINNTPKEDENYNKNDLQPPLNNTIEQNNSTIDAFNQQATEQLLQENKDRLEQLLQETKPKTELPKIEYIQIPDLEEKIKPKAKPKNIIPSKYPTETDLDVLYGN